MRKLLLLVLMLLSYVCFCGDIVRDNVIFKNNVNESLFINVKNNYDLKTLHNNDEYSFNFKNRFLKNSYSILNPNSLFFTGGDILNEDFETASGWTFTNGIDGNKWVIGSAVNNGGAKSLYISKGDDLSYAYDVKSATVVHAYKDINIPATTEEISVSFDWKCLGEGTDPKKHFFNVWLVPDTFVPVSGTGIFGWINDGRTLLGSFNNNSTDFKNEFIGVDTGLLKGKKGKIVFEWINDTIGGWHPPAAIDNLKISTFKCSKPSNITFEDIKADSVLMKWDASNSASAEYEIYYSKENISPASDIVSTKVGIKTTSLLLDNLDSSSFYYVWIRSICGSDKGRWSNVYRFKTACGVMKIPFWEGFNSNSPSANCWTITDENKDSFRWKSNFSAFEGNRAMLYSNFNDAIVNDDWLISPTIKLNGTYRLRYHYKVSGPSEFEVLLSKNGIETNDFKQTLVVKKTYENTDYIEKTLILYNIVGDINIAWHAIGKGKSNIYIDNIIIEDIDTCPEPMELFVKDIKLDQATIFWKDDFGGNKWEYYVQEKGKGAPVNTVSGVSTVIKEAIITKDIDGNNLNSNTAYEYFIRTVCEDGKYSIWSDSFEFRTECDVLTIPFSEGFNTDSDNIYCWTIIDENNDNKFWISSFDAFEGDRAMNFYKSSKDSVIVNDDWLISPTLKMNGTYRLKYHYKVIGSSEFEVLLSKDGKNIKDFKQSLVATKKYFNNKYIEKTIILYNIVGDINIAWHANGKGDSKIFIDNIIIEEVEVCPEPFELDVKDIMSDKVTVLWTDEFGATNWEYFVQAEGKGEPTKNGTLTANKNNTITVDNETGGVLLANTSYEFYVRTVCGSGENSIWSGPFKFRTACASFATPFQEGFNKDSKTIDCWSIVDGNKDNNNSWVTNSVAFEGDRAMYFNNFSSDSTFVNDDWLISPTIKMNGTYRLKYHYRVSGSGEFEVLLSKDGREVKDFKQSLVATKTHKNTNYIEKIVIINNIVGDVNIAWHAKGGGSSNIYIDNIIIEEVEGCPEPYNIDVKDILFNGATIFWTDDSGAKKWEYFVRPVGISKGEPTKSGTVVSTKENIITTENETNSTLLSNTEYEFYVRTVCEDGTNSIWSGPIEFLTDCAVYDLPFWEGFNKSSESVGCWIIEDGNKDNVTWNVISFNDFEGGQTVRFSKFSDNDFVNDEWLITPTIKTDGGMYRIKYHYRTNSLNNNEFEILMSTKGVDIKNFTETVLPKQVYKNSKYIEKIIFVNNLNGDVNFAWHLTSKGTTNVFLDNVFIEKVENCAEPIELDVKDVMTDKATILWTDDLNDKSWEYFVQTIGKGEPTKKGTITSKKENIVTVENETNSALKHNTDYEYYVRTVCDDGTNSIWSGPFVFRTVCGVFDLPFWEGFNKDSESFRCWTIIDENNDKITWNPSSIAYEGDQAISLVRYSSNSKLVNDDWLISPSLKTNGGMYRIKYHYRTDPNYNSEFEILMSTKGIDVKDFTKTILPKKVYKKDNYNQEVVFVDNLNGDVNFAWHITNNGSSRVYLDNIFIDKVKNCPEPYYVEITEQTDSSISIEWEQYGVGSKWEVIAVPYEEEIPNEKDLRPIVVTDTKATITGLDSGKPYKFYVRVICENGNPSDWSVEKTASTKVKTNDDCSGAYNIPVNEGADCKVFTSVTLFGASLSETDKKSCKDGDKIKSDVWFEFTATAKIHIINISDIISPSGGEVSFSMALYSDDCEVSNSPIDCHYFYYASSPSKKFTDLEIGKKYYLRIYSTSESEAFFKLCISRFPYLYVSPSGEDYTLEELVKDVLVESNCDLVSNIKYQSGDNSEINTFGYFYKEKSDFPFEKGIVLATHAVNYTSGPYVDVSERGKLPAWLGDPDLNEVIDKIGGSGFGSTKFASVLEFDFIPIKDSFKFEYIFASESYGTCTVQCNHGGALFAAWLTEEESGIGQNLALVPGTTEPIAISTIRDSDKTGAKCESVEPQFFGECYSNPLSGSDPSKAPVNYAGLTVPMTSEKVVVNPGKKYHIKIAIADYCDNPKHVSAVFFRAGSFDLGDLDLGEDLLVSNNTALCGGEEKIIYSGLDKKSATIKWYKDGNLIPGENEAQLTVSELGDYEVVGKYEEYDCEVKGSIRIEIYPKVVTEAPEDVVFCVNSISGKEFIDITTNEQIILKDLNTEEFEFYYYLSKEDSEKEENAIENPTEFEIPKDKKAQEIFVRIFNKVTACSVFNQFSLVPEKIGVPESPGDQQVCARYTFKELPKNQHYFAEKGAKGREYIAGDIIDKPGDYTIYICTIIGDCYDEVSFNLEIIPPVKAKVFGDETMKCYIYELGDLPSGNRYFTESDAQGVELFAGDMIRFTQTIYVYAQSETGPNYCTDQSSFTITFEECPIPKGISPNGDGINDALDLEVNGVTSIVIYNRYGTVVYSHGEGYTNQWRGQDKSGNELPDGTYYYVIEARGKTKTGWIQVNR